LRAQRSVRAGAQKQIHQFSFAARLKRELFEEDFARSYELTEPVSIEWVDFLADLLLEGV